MNSTLDFHPSKNCSNEHVGIIPDGSRRWSKREGISLREGYDHAMDHLGTILDTLYSAKVKTISVYLSSAQNFRRSAAEIAAFCDAESDACERVFQPLAKQHELHVKTVGSLAPLTAVQRSSFLNFQNLADSSNKELNLCVAYDPFDEIDQALRIAQLGNRWHKHLSIPRPLDFIIRTGGSQVLSNFLPLQSGFARLFFSDKLFNDYGPNEALEILMAYREQTRLYGE